MDMVGRTRKLRVPKTQGLSCWQFTKIAFLRLLFKSINYWKDHGLNSIFFVMFSLFRLFNPSEILCCSSFNHNNPRVRSPCKRNIFCRRKPADRVQRFWKRGGQVWKRRLEVRAGGLFGEWEGGGEGGGFREDRLRGRSRREHWWKIARSSSPDQVLLTVPK